MNSLLLIYPYKGSGLKPILSGKPDGRLTQINADNFQRNVQYPKRRARLLDEERHSN